MPPPGLDNLKHLVVLMMENRSFDHMLGGLRAVDPRIDGLTGNESNPDPAGNLHKVESKAKYQSQLDPDPNHDFAPVDMQIFNGGNVATMQGFVNSYFAERQDADHARQIMYYFKPARLPVLTTLAREYAVFNRWFSSIPGPTLCNRAFAHYGSSFGHVGMELFYANVPFRSIYQRLEAAGRTAKIYFFDQVSSTMEIVNLIQNQPQFFGTFDQFLSDCQNGQLPDYSFVEPNYTDHDGTNGRLIASDQHPDHHVRSSSRPRALDINGPNECSTGPTSDSCPPVSVSSNRSGTFGFRLMVSRSGVSGGGSVPFYFQHTLGGDDVNGSKSLASYADYRFRGPHVLLLQESLEHSIWGPFGVWLAADQGKVALQDQKLDFTSLRKSYAIGLTVRAGGAPQALFAFATGGSEGNHFAVTVTTSLFGGSARPSLN